MLLVQFSRERLGDYQKMARALRAEGFGVDVYPEPKKVGQQLKYAEQRGFRLALIAGPDEFAQDVWKIKYLANRQDPMSANAAYIGLGVSSLDSATAEWQHIQQSASGPLDLPGRCFALLGDGTQVLVDRGGQDVFGHYEVVSGWPKPLASLPGHEGWTWGAGQSVFAASPDRVFVLQRGELPVLARPPTRAAPSLRSTNPITRRPSTSPRLPTRGKLPSRITKSSPILPDPATSTR